MEQEVVRVHHGTKQGVVLMASPEDQESIDRAIEKSKEALEKELNK